MEIDVTGQRRVKTGGGPALSVYQEVGRKAGEPGGGARLLCFFRAAEDILKQLLPLNGKMAH